MKSKGRSFARAMRPESGITLVELTIVALITAILVVSLVTAMRNVVGGALVAKERDRALALAQDKLDEVKKRGYDALRTKVSFYVYPTDPDPDVPLSQKSDLPPYPNPPPLVPEEDPWTPEYIRLGRTSFWRHVTIKFVEETAVGLVQKPEPNPPSITGGTDSSSGLMHIEVAVTWFSRAANHMRQVRVTSLLANLALPITNIGRIAGTIFDDGANIPSPADDTRVTGKSMIVNATHQGTGKTYSVTVDPADGSYSIESLPDGEYVVKVVGPGYADSSYAVGNTDFDGNPFPNISPPTFQDTVLIEVGSKENYNIGIWTTKVARVKIYGKFEGAKAGDQVYIDSGDGTSSGTNFTVGVGENCDADPCWFVIDDVAWPVTGTKTFILTLENRTTAKFTEATICMDSAALPLWPVGTATDYYWGVVPDDLLAFPTLCGVCVPPCQTPDPNYPAYDVPLDVDDLDNTPAEVKVHVKEYYNGTTSNLASAFVFVTDGISATAFTAPSGKATVSSVAPSEAGTVKVIVSMPGSGYTTEERKIDEDILAGETVDIEADPFILRRVSIVSGTVWKICDGGSPPCGPASQGLANHPMTINNPTTGFSAAMLTDGAGRFVHEGIIQETSAYRITPAVGSDFSSSPKDLTVNINTNGVNYWESSPGTPLEFVLTIINGTLKGAVTKNGKPYAKGALVIATTYTGAFPTVLPSSDLSGEYTYSTVTETDGKYELKVATGVGDYTVYAFSSDGDAPSGGPYTVPADSEVTAADLVIP